MDCSTETLKLLLTQKENYKHDNISKLNNNILKLRGKENIPYSQADNQGFGERSSRSSRAELQPSIRIVRTQLISGLWKSSLYTFPETRITYKKTGQNERERSDKVQ